MSWKVVISLLHTVDLNDSCHGGLALIRHNNQDNPTAPCSWELPYPCFLCTFVDVKRPKQFSGLVGLFFPPPGSYLFVNVKGGFADPSLREGLALQRAVQVQ